MNPKVEDTPTSNEKSPLWRSNKVINGHPKNLLTSTLLVYLLEQLSSFNEKPFLIRRRNLSKHGCYFAFIFSQNLFSVVVLSDLYWNLYDFYELEKKCLVSTTFWKRTLGGSLAFFGYFLDSDSRRCADDDTSCSCYYRHLIESRTVQGW